jgi:hypothetical protein
MIKLIDLLHYIFDWGAQWAFPISDLQRVTTYADDPQAFSITVDTRAAERKQVKSSVTYLVDNKHERAILYTSFSLPIDLMLPKLTVRSLCSIREVKRLYFQATRTELEEEQTTSKTPKKYCAPPPSHSGRAPVVAYLPPLLRNLTAQEIRGWEQGIRTKVLLFRLVMNPFEEQT